MIARRLRVATAAATTAALLLLPAVAHADNFVANGDDVGLATNGKIDFGEICAGTTVSKTFPVAVRRASSGAAFTNGATVAFAVGAVDTSGGRLSTATPVGGTIGTTTLPSTWSTASAGTYSGTVATTVSFKAGAAGTQQAGSVTFVASGPVSNGKGTAEERVDVVTNKVVTCAPSAPKDTTAPVLSLPQDVTAEATSGSGAAVTYAATAVDAVDGARPVSCSPASGSTFPLGVTTVSCSATDATGNTATGSFLVTVRDTTAPVLGDIATIEATEATSSTGAIVKYTAPDATDAVSGNRPVQCTPVSGSTFTLGDTDVVCTAVDAVGNTARRTSVVRVQDTTKPVLVLPDSVTEEATGPSGAVVSYEATADDVVDGRVTPACVPSSGSVFALGERLVACSATDAARNHAEGSFLVTVQDTTAPTIDAVESPDPVEATGPAGAAVTFAAPVARDLVDGKTTSSCSPASGSTFPVGTTKVTCTALDRAGNAADEVGFGVVVRDTTPPTLTLPGDLTVRDGAPVTYSATATDLVDPNPVVLCSVASGSAFRYGATPVTCTAEDAEGNKAKGAFTVTVQRTLTGFQRPVDQNRVVNTFKAGQTIPLKFEVFETTTEISTLDVVKALSVKQVPCDLGAGSDPVELVTTGSTSLRYDTTGGHYIQNWKTPGDAKGKCYQVAVETTDGATQVASFQGV